MNVRIWVKVKVSGGHLVVLVRVRSMPVSHHKDSSVCMCVCVFQSLLVSKHICPCPKLALHVLH